MVAASCRSRPTPVSGPSSAVSVARPSRRHRVVAEISPAETVKPSQLHGRLRPDGGVIDVVADYGCFAAPWLDTDLCPSVYEDNRRRVYALYAFQVE